MAINAQATLKAPHALIWATLTDYDHLAGFIPGMTASRVIERRSGGLIIVEQTGAVGLLFFSYPIAVTVESREEPPAFIGIRALKGNLKQLEGAYRIEKVAGKDDEFVLRWSGLIEPSVAVPFFISVPLMRSNISHQFHGMVSEIERRAALSREKPEGE